MVYQNQLIAVIKSNGRILRESKSSANTVYLPFNTEYEIFFKNLNSRDALINISIDGEDVSDNSKLIIRANSSGSLEGFLKNNRVTNKFKFIQKTANLTNCRGDRIDDGIIRIEYRFAKVKPVTITTTYIHRYESVFHPISCICPICRPNWTTHMYFPFQPVNSTADQSSEKAVYISSSINPSIYSSFTASDQQVLKSSLSKSEINQLQQVYNSQDLNSDEGITVKGSESDQIFENSFISEVEENSYVIILNLRGYLGKTNQPVQKPITVETKLVCSTCGRKNKSRFKYCSECGTALF